MLPKVVTDAAIEAELPGAVCWATRHRIAMDTSCVKNQIIRVELIQEGENEKFFLQGNFEDYKALPPIWDWRDETWLVSGEPQLSPQPENNPFGSMFIRHEDSSVICAPFNRWAYGAHDGPHSDWKEPAQWLTTGAGHIHAITIGDMLQAILRDFTFTKGRMA